MIGGGLMQNEREKVGASYHVRVLVIYHSNVNPFDLESSHNNVKCGMCCFYV